MQRINTLLRTFGIVGFCGLAALAHPRPAHAGGVHVSVGFGLPGPVFVAPAPVVIAPQPTVVYPAPPVYVQPAPVVVEQPPVVVQPQVVYGQPSYRGYAYYGGYRRPWRHHHHDDGDHEEHGQYWRPNDWHGWRRW
jgi:hypothetical protein